MKSLEEKFEKHIIRISNQYVFLKNEKELHKVLECSKPLSCQREYMINYILYLLNVIMPKRSLSRSENKDIIFILNGIFECGFKPVGLYHSEICSGILSLGSEKSYQSFDCSKSYLEFKTNSAELISTLSELKSIKANLFEIKNQGSILHYWQIIEILFSSHIVIEFLNQHYNNSYCWNEKALGLFQLMDSKLFMSIVKSFILNKDIMCNVYDTKSSYFWNNCEGLAFVAHSFQKCI